MEVPITSRKTVNQRINEILSTTRGKVYFTLIATLLVVGLMIVFAVLPAYTSIFDQLATIEMKKLYLSDLKAKVQSVNTLNVQYRKYQNEIIIFNTYFGEKQNTELVIASLYKILETNECTITNVTLNSSATSEYVQLINVANTEFTAQTQCPFNKIPGIYNQITNYAVPMSIKSLTFTQVGATGAKYDLTLVGEYYYWKP